MKRAVLPAIALRLFSPAQGSIKGNPDPASRIAP